MRNGIGMLRRLQIGERRVTWCRVSGHSHAGLGTCAVLGPYVTQGPRAMHDPLSGLGCCEGPGHHAGLSPHMR